VVIAPPLELANQVYTELVALGRDLTFKACAIYGGVDKKVMVREVLRGFNMYQTPYSWSWTDTYPDGGLIYTVRG